MSPVFSTISTAFDRKSVSSAHFLNSSNDLSSFAPEKDVVFIKISLELPVFNTLELLIFIEICFNEFTRKRVRYKRM